MTSLLTISPAARVTAGFVLVSPAVSVTEPDARRKPSAVATTVYVPAGAVRLNVPSGFGVTDVTAALLASYRVTVTGLPSWTSPVRVPVVGTGVEVGVGDSRGVDVNVGVGDSTGVEVNVAVGGSVGVEVGSSVTGVEVNVGVGDSIGVSVTVGVGDSMGVEVNVGVGVSNGVGVSCVSIGVGVGVLSRKMIDRLAGVDGSAVNTPSPFEIRAWQSIAVCPPCKPVTSKTNAAPPPMAFLPLLPAIATMKLPFCGVVAAITGSSPKRSVRLIFPIWSKPALYVQVNS